MPPPPPPGFVVVVGGAVVGGLVDGGAVAGRLVAGGLVGGGLVGVGAGAVATAACADGAEGVGGAPVVPRAGWVVVGPAPEVADVEVASDVRGADVVVGAEGRAGRFAGVDAPDDAQAVTSSPPATTRAIDRTMCRMWSFLPVRGIA